MGPRCPETPPRFQSALLEQEDSNLVSEPGDFRAFEV